MDPAIVQLITALAPSVLALIRDAITALTGPTETDPRRELAPGLVQRASRVVMRLERTGRPGDEKRASAQRVLWQWNAEIGAVFSASELNFAIELAVSAARRRRTTQ